MESVKNKGGRPKKEGSRKEAVSANWRIVIPNLQEYKDSSAQQLMNLKYSTLQLLKQRQRKYNLRYYCVALEHHANGVPHLDILLVYPKSVHHKLNHFDYLIKHGKLTTYRKLNASILDYGKKEDVNPLSNLPEDTSQIIQVQDLKKDPYAYFYDKMKQDPLHFNLEQYVQRNQLSKHFSGWSTIKTKLKDMQTAAANLQLKNKPGFKYIDRTLIESVLSQKQLLSYDSWNGYQKIVDYLNQIVTEGGIRQMKTLNLLITGPPSIGKTSLFHNPNHKADKSCVQDFLAVYPMGMTTWFPNYLSGVYKLILWNEAKLTSYSYDLILKLLEGSYVDLPTKGGVAPKRDNPLIIMTSNMTLEQMIEQKFNNSSKMRDMARKNLAVRIENVVVPKDTDLFLLQKLLIKKEN